MCKHCGHNHEHEHGEHHSHHEHNHHECYCENHNHHEHHHHHHEHEEDEEFSLKNVILCIILFASGLLCEHLKINAPVFVKYQKAASLLMYFFAYMLVGKDVLKEAVESLFKGRCFNEEFLMSVATIGAIVTGEYAEAVAVMLLFQIGEFLEDKANGKTEKSIESLLDIRSDTAILLLDGKEEVVAAQDVKSGDIIIVKPGMRVPLDGIIEGGKTFVDTSALTGESVPRELCEGNEILSGFINSSSVIQIKVTKEFSQSTVSRILDMVKDSQEKKSRSEKFISKFAKVYTPIVCILAVAVAILPPFVSGADRMTWIYRACEMLVVSCPCALVISVPLSFFSGIGLFSKNGILVKGSNYIDALSKVKVVVCDKTGTLTKGVFEVTEVHPAVDSISAEELVALAAHAEYYSEHPVSVSLKNNHKCSECGTLTVKEAEEISGHGIKVMLEGRQVLCGNKKLMQKEAVEGFVATERKSEETVVYVAQDKKYLGYIVISDILKEDSAEAVLSLKKAGVSKVVMLTGDSENAASAISEKLGLDGYYAELLPVDKVSKVEKLISENNGKVLFAGDGINDAPVLSRSDVGVAMGALGSDAAIEAADVVIMDDKISRIAIALRLAKKTMKNVHENIVFAIGVKVLILGLCVSGFANMWTAVFGDVGVTLLAVMNSMRLLKKKKV